jgi:hypothetical protein
VFGERVAAELGGVRGASVLWWDGGGDARGAWAAVGLDASEAVLADLPTLVASAIGRVTDEQLRAAAVHRAQSRARADASPAATADRVARTRLRGERRDGDAPRTWASLRAARPSYVIGRPR